MHDLGRHRRALDHCPAACRGRWAWSAARRPRSRRADLPADQRQPCRLRQAGQSRMRSARCEEAIDKVKAMPAKPSFMIHTGDITHLSQARPNSTTPTASSRRPSSTCITCRASMTSSTREVKAYSTATARAPRARAGIPSTHHGVHFIGLVNVVDLKAGGLGRLGARAARLARRRSRGTRPTPRRSSCSRISRCGRIRRMGLGHRGCACRRSRCCAFRRRSPC